jgi:DNA-binding NtrC family response regulator
MRLLFGVLARLEGSLASVLIQGESGTGKELVARALHEASSVADGPFIAVNCGAIDRSLVRSELFGHRKGAFTGASEAAVGAFEAANGGTLLLDEVGELPLDVQPVLLRALETRSIVRLGENEPRPVKVRALAATHRDLEADVAEGRFRRDLFYRLVVIKLLVPPLRERREDIERIASRFAVELGIGALDETVLDELGRRDYPGNVRELKNLVEAYAVLGALPSLEGAVRGDLEALFRGIADSSRPYAEQKDALIDAFTRVYLEKLLAATGGNQSKAARIAGLHRGYLARLLGKVRGDESDQFERRK